MKITFKQEIKADQQISNQEIVDLILKNRQIKDKKSFLYPIHPDKINLLDFNPAFKNKIKKTIELLKKIKEKNQMIVVYTDYDADGITGGAILWETLYLLGFKIMPYVPHRKHEGYGFSIKGIDNVKKQFNPALIISVDHGITAWEKVEYAKSLGIPIIITDHHLKPDILPTKAEVIFHIPELSGSGVSYFFAKEIFENFSRTPEVDWQKLENNFQSDYLALASIGTIADLVPLIGPSRSIVKYGLEAFSKLKRVGLKQIIKDAGIEDKKITPYHIGFMIAPRINAVGRLEHAIDALRLLCTTDLKRAETLSNHVGLKNKERQDMVEKAVEEARLRVKSSAGEQNKLPRVIIIKNANFHEGIIGLIASKIAEEFYRPTIILTENDGQLKGSARSIPSFHITNFLRDLKRYLIDVGGHKGAAGFTMEKAKYDNFVTAVAKLSLKLIKDKDLERTIEADLKIPLSKVTLNLVNLIENLQPFGIGNPNPTFLSEGEIIDIGTFGKNNDHLKLYIKQPQQLAINNPSSLLRTSQQFPLELIAFNKSAESKNISKGQRINVVYSLEIDRWGGQERLRGKIVRCFSIKLLS